MATSPDPEVPNLESEIRRAVAGEKDALDLVLGHSWPWLKNVVGSLMSKRLLMRVDVEDEVQEVCLRIIRGFPKFKLRDNPTEDFKAWASTIARRRIALLAREQIEMVETFASAEDPTSGPKTPSRIASERETIEFLQAAIAKLSPEDRELLESFAIKQESQKTIADLRSMTPDAVKMRLARIKVRLRSLMGSSGLYNIPGLTRMSHNRDNRKDDRKPK